VCSFHCGVVPKDPPASRADSFRGSACRLVGTKARPRSAGSVRRADGYQTATPALGLASVSDDGPIVRSTLDSIPGDKILVGHSYGGFVITNAASGRSDVRGLVYTAAYVPDSGETINSLSVGYAPGAFLAHLVFAPSFPFVIVDPQFFPEDFAQDLNPKLGAEIAAQHRPTSLGLFGTPSGPAPGMRSRRGTQFRPTTAPSTLPCSVSWPRALDRRPSASLPRATWAASPTTGARFVKLIEQAVQATGT
jgi:pimeloyl-ACP methyl ester carboxylesterase